MRHTSHVPTLLLSLAVLAGSAWAQAAEQDAGSRVRYDGHVVVRVQADTVRQVQTALALTNDLWTHGAGVGTFDMRVTPEQRAALDASGLNYQVLIPDLQARIDAETARLAAAAAGAGDEGGIAADDWFMDFKTRTQINARMDEYVATHPTLVSAVSVGTSFDGRPIRGIRISRSTNPNAPAFLFDSCQHAREWATPMTAMYIADRLVEGAASDPRLTALLDRAAVFVIPVVNVDGYEYTWTNERLWRKTRQPNGDGSWGTDTNRNWGYQWGGQGASNSGFDETYRGLAPFSAPETAAMRDFYLAHPEIIGSIDVHSYSQLLMWPWAYTSALCPDHALHLAVGLAMQSSMEASAGTTYTAGPVYTTIYPASGGAVDWTYGDQGVTSYTIEVRDTGTYGFVMPPEEILPNARENYAGVLTMMEGLLGPAIILPNGEMPIAVLPNVSTSVSVLVTPTNGTIQALNLRARVGTNGPFAVIPLKGQLEFYSADLPAAPCGQTIQYWFEAVGADGSTALPEGAPAVFFSALVQEHIVLFQDDFETNMGWNVGSTSDNATGGIWVRVDPVGTPAQPEDDHSPFGNRCWVTGQGASGGPTGAADVDGGTTTLMSPVLDGTDFGAELVYWRWYSNDQGSAPNLDSMPVEWSIDGNQWNLLEDVSENAHAWVERRFLLSSFLPSPGPFRIRFRARDLGNGSIVEAGVDDVSIVHVSCPFALADLNHDGAVDGADLGILLGAWGQQGSSADLTGDGAVDGADLGLLLSSWS